jgi:hypothetical protein
MFVIFFFNLALQIIAQKQLAVFSVTMLKKLAENYYCTGKYFFRLIPQKACPHV